MGVNGGNSRRRAGKQARARIRGEIWSATRNHWRLLASVLGVWFLATVAVVGSGVVTGRTHLAAFFGGLMVGALALLCRISHGAGLHAPAAGR